MAVYEIQTEKSHDGWWATCYDRTTGVTGEMRKPKQSEPAAIKVAVSNALHQRGPES